jgi:hypothetical protein
MVGDKEPMSGNTKEAAIKALLDAQRKAFLADSYPSAKLRIARIDRVKDLLLGGAGHSGMGRQYIGKAF